MRDRRGKRKKRTDKQRPREGERKDTESKRMGELAMEIEEGIIATKVKEKKTSRKTHHFYYNHLTGRTPANKIPKKKKT